MNLVTAVVFQKNAGINASDMMVTYSISKSAKQTIELIVRSMCPENQWATLHFHFSTLIFHFHSVKLSVISQIFFVWPIKLS